MLFLNLILIYQKKGKLQFRMCTWEHDDWVGGETENAPQK